jgi:hypothetical protein
LEIGGWVCFALLAMTLLRFARNDNFAISLPRYLIICTPPSSPSPFPTFFSGVWFGHCNCLR